jgi:hypothetical protein
MLHAIGRAVARTQIQAEWGSDASKGDRRFESGSLQRRVIQNPIIPTDLDGQAVGLPSPSALPKPLVAAMGEFAIEQEAEPVGMSERGGFVGGPRKVSRRARRGKRESLRQPESSETAKSTLRVSTARGWWGHCEIVLRNAPSR